ncbi:MAG: BadF/BadG/BcrA/BcrD ATPase family protein [Gammaproteobacteria bacterium]|nr:BadF/BadG/BcrA/BcrD ATPase family protein [Gammaproteobacteria bacterium]
MAQDIFIGIDGGASKCKSRVEDAHGKLLGHALGGPANIRLSVDHSWQSVYHSIEEVLKLHGISLQDKNYRFHVGMGLAGCEVPAAREDFLSRAHPFTTIYLTSDAHVACLGAHGGQDGSIIIIGTGVIGYEIQDGVGLSVGGWGFPHDDEGGGAWLGMEVARLTFSWIDHRVEKSALLEEVFAFFNNDIAEFATWANSANSSEFARLAPLVINHSQQADPWAIHLMKRAAIAINRVGVALEKIHVHKNLLLPCSLFGGVAPFVEPWLDEALRSRLVSRQGDANVGAILMVKQVLEKQKQVS